MIETFIGSDDIDSYLQRVDPTSTTGRTTRDAWKAFLVTQTNSDGTTYDLEKDWLRSEGATGETLLELWGSHTSNSGYTNGEIKDRMRAFLEVLRVLPSHYCKKLVLQGSY